MRLFALEGSLELGRGIANAMDTVLDAHEERNFEDGEHKIRPLINVRDEDAYVIHSLHATKHQSVNDKLCKLLFFIATLKDAGARRVTAVVPYLCYARKDRRTKARDPVTVRYVAGLFESVGTDRIVTVDVHNMQAFQNAFRCNTEHIEAQKLFVSYFQQILKSGQDVVVMSPDIGGVKRAELFRDKLSRGLSRPVDFAFMEKLRSKDVVSGETVVGDVSGKHVIILDDLISSGTTMARAADACVQQGAVAVNVVATHAAFSPKAVEVLRSQSISQVVVTNTISPLEMNDRSSVQKVIVLDIAPLLGEVIRRLHTSGSIVTLMEME